MLQNSTVLWAPQDLPWGWGGESHGPLPPSHGEVGSGRLCVLLFYGHAEIMKWETAQD